MKLSTLLDRLKKETGFSIEERKNSDGLQQFILSTVMPFPLKQRPEWYVFTLPKGVAAENFEIEESQTEAMLRHLWMYQVDVNEPSSEMTEADNDAIAELVDDPSDGDK
jgi:hypothetical protein